MIVVIDNTEDGSVTFFAVDGNLKAKKFDTQRNLAKLLDEWLKKNKKTLDDVKGVSVVEGSISFTSSRIAATFANTLAFARQIPVFSVKKDCADKEVLTLFKKTKVGKYILPKYSGEANIGIKK